MTTRRGFLGLLAALPMSATVKALPAAPPLPAAQPATLLRTRPTPPNVLLHIRRRIVQLYGQHDFPITVARGTWENSTDGGVTWQRVTEDSGIKIEMIGRGATAEPVFFVHGQRIPADQVRIDF